MTILSPKRLAVLITLSAGEYSTSQIAAAHGSTHSAIRMLTRVLKEYGLIIKSSRSVHVRMNIWKLTPLGFEALREASGSREFKAARKIAAQAHAELKTERCDVRFTEEDRRRRQASDPRFRMAAKPNKEYEK